MIKMALQIPPQAKPAGIENAHASDQNTPYVIFGSGNSWSRKPDSVFSYFLYKKSIICLFKEKKNIICFQNNSVY